MADSAPVGIVDSRLATESHSLLQDRLVSIGNPRSFVYLQADPVSGAVLEELLKTSLADLVECFPVDLFGDRSFFQIIDAGIVGGQHGVIEAFGIVGRLPYDERSLALNGVATNLARVTED